MKTTTAIAATVATLLGAAFACFASGPMADPPETARAPSARLPPPGSAWVVFGADTVVAEVASTAESRERGLQGRTEVPDGTGMLFVFPRAEEISFWMKDTPVALDVAFFDDENRIVGIRGMDAFDEGTTDSPGPTALALEVRRGWFAERGIGEGRVASVVFGPGPGVRRRTREGNRRPWDRVGQARKPEASASTRASASFAAL